MPLSSAMVLRSAGLAPPPTLASEAVTIRPNPPNCAAAVTAPDPSLTNLHYLNMYWLRDPIEQTVAEWNELAERSFHWGRRDDVHIANRLLMDFFRPVKGYVNPRVLVSAEALPYRP